VGPAVGQPIHKPKIDFYDPLSLYLSDLFMIVSTSSRNANWLELLQLPHPKPPWEAWHGAAQEKKGKIFKNS